ncbi:hypothetical protein [Vibrio maerlii]|uniref:hypothetical protein n=1 Tax=Vibrio maerlii TaxID=2231648 RepID=UPI000E3C50A8|nr:hypothetical protein [Vibrio maerlii]
MIRAYNKQAASKPLTLKESEAYTKDIFAVYTNMASTKVDLSKSIKALLSIQAAHSKLASEVTNDKFDGPKIMEIVGELQNQWKHYGGYRDLVSECNGKWELEEAKSENEKNNKGTTGKVLICKIEES